MKRLAAIALLMAITLGLAIGQSAGWRVDKGHSGIVFTIKHMVISEVTGRFKDFDITVTSTKDDFSDLAIETTIQANSVDTNNEGRDRDLRSDNFFSVDKFPAIKFKSTSVEKVSDHEYKITGNLTIRDTTKQVTFDTSLNGIIKGARGDRAGWTAKLTVNRFDYGLKWNRMIETGGLVAGENVNITVNIEMLKQPGN